MNVKITFFRMSYWRLLLKGQIQPLDALTCIGHMILKAEFGPKSEKTKGQILLLHLQRTNPETQWQQCLHCTRVPDTESPCRKTLHITASHGAELHVNFSVNGHKEQICGLTSGLEVMGDRIAS